MRSALASVLCALPLLVACEAPPPEPSAGSAQKDPAGPTGVKSAATGQGATTATAQAVAKGPFPESTNPAMTDPSKATEKAPEKFTVKFETTAGDFNVECTREWAPNGVDRFYNLVKIGFFDDVSLFRAVKGFVVQFGIHGNPEVSAKWRDAQLPKDDVKGSNSRGMLTYAMAGSPDTRTTQLFINLKDNANLDGMGFAPICKVTDEGMASVDKIFMGYGEKPSKAQGTIQMQGNKFLRQSFPELDYIKTVRLVGDDAAPASSASAGPA
ncbi:MAG: peptidylprolyl isomerase, partial [Myxococcales bacterium]|nr:peptidylprolyl isomerase [Myxococcales bacterium]